MGIQVHAKFQRNRPSPYRDTAGGTFVSPLRWHAPRATMGTDIIRHWSQTWQEGWGYPPKKAACQSGIRFQRYKKRDYMVVTPLKSMTTAGGPLILRFLVYISRNSLRASRSLVIILSCVVVIIAKGSEKFCGDVSFASPVYHMSQYLLNINASLWLKVFGLLEFNVKSIGICSLRPPVIYILPNRF